ncbi:hypothetical protein [Rhizobium leguminosarum]|nr:hypothetical protein [Rhizobium leguminosarum]
MIEEKALPDMPTRAGQAAVVGDTLEGYDPIGLDHFLFAGR